MNSSIETAEVEEASEEMAHARTSNSIACRDRQLLVSEVVEHRSRHLEVDWDAPLDYFQAYWEYGVGLVSLGHLHLRKAEDQLNARV